MERVIKFTEKEIWIDGDKKDIEKTQKILSLSRTKSFVYWYFNKFA